MTLARTRINFLAVGVFALVLVGTQKSPASAATPPATPPDVPQAKPSPLLAVMKGELDRSFKTLSTQDPAAYYIGYTITDTQRAEVSGSNGALLSSGENRNRWLEVGARNGRSDRQRSGSHAPRNLAGNGQAIQVSRRVADQDQNRARS